MNTKDYSFKIGATAALTGGAPALRWRGEGACGPWFLFLAVWLVIGLSAGAASPPKKAQFNPNLQVSAYEPTNTRNPFMALAGAGGGPAAPGAAFSFQLEGILYEPTRPSAIVNGQLVFLNKPATVTIGGVEVPIKATAITRQSVTLEVHGQSVELQIKSDKSSVKP
jgi:hypothetical protein